MSTPTDTSTSTAAERIADEVIARSLEFDSVRDMLIAAASDAMPESGSAGSQPIIADGCNGLCLADRRDEAGWADLVTFGHPDCPCHGHAGRLGVLLHELAQAQAAVDRLHIAAAEDGPSGMLSSDAAVGNRDGVLTAIAVQMLRHHLQLSPDTSVSDVREKLVRPAVDADRWQAPSRAYRAAITVVLRALGVLPEMLPEAS